MSNVLAKYIETAEKTRTLWQDGKVVEVIGLIITSTGPATSVGELCKIYPHPDAEPVLAEVVGFRKNKVLLMPLGELSGINPGSLVVATGDTLSVGVGEELIGRVIGGMGEPLDGKGPINASQYRPIYAMPPDPMSRTRISEPLVTGVRALDSFVTCGKGQRMGIFAGSGVGKSVLMGMIARNTRAPINVIGLIGERGREVREFIEKDLGEEGLSRSVVVSVTSDMPPLVKVKGALAATTIAEYFRSQGRDVILMMDSVTRIAMALREIGLAVGEPPATKGYTPSVFTFLPRFLERAGTSKHGSITGLYTVLVEGDDLNDPVSDTVRSILDGHVVLSRRLANRNHYPAIEVLESVSRLIVDITDDKHKNSIHKMKSLMSAYHEAEDLINIGAYEKGSDTTIDESIQKIDEINSFLRQGIDEKANFEEDLNTLRELAEREKVPVQAGKSPVSQNNPQKAGAKGPGRS
ncbi:MAG: flagellar protein export ATPase FliI [candidate division Zixibacteria bacterium]|nr:flagellar protein export ATPase FliI [candidate division Zixibacteria bacterium]